MHIGYHYIEENYTKYLLHQDGSKFRVTTHISELNDHIEALDLSGKPWTTIPEIVFDFKQIRVLILSSMHITSLSPKIGNLTNLVSLSVSNNKIKELPTEIGLLTQLKHLDVRYCYLKKLPQQIECLKNLIILDVRSNELLSLPAQIAQTNLSYFNGGDNRITDISEGIIALKLKSLDLNKNEIKVWRT